MDLPLIFDIRRGSMDDGPGIRTTVFFKGCPLACVWCHNPESVQSRRELSWDLQSCINCNSCESVCLYGATAVMPELTLHRERCRVCGACALECPVKARKVVGSEYSTCELVDILKSDTDYYLKSGGGVTFSGGEPLLHVSYLTEVMSALKRADIHIAVQTCGFFDIDSFRNHLLPYIDLVYFDLKLIDPAAHRDFTGVDNGLILANFSTLAKKLGEKLIPRIPLVPEITATTQNLSGIARFLQQSGYDSCDVLPYNPAGITKRHRMGQPVLSGLSTEFMGRDQERELLESFRRQLESGSVTLH